MREAIINALRELVQQADVLWRRQGISFLEDDATRHVWLARSSTHICIALLVVFF